MVMWISSLGVDRLLLLGTITGCDAVCRQLMPSHLIIRHRSLRTEEIRHKVVGLCDYSLPNELFKTNTMPLIQDSITFLYL